jgi:hypothetical protein
MSKNTAQMNSFFVLLLVHLNHSHVFQLLSFLKNRGVRLCLFLLAPLVPGVSVGGTGHLSSVTNKSFPLGCGS